MAIRAIKGKKRLVIIGAGVLALLSVVGGLTYVLTKGSAETVAASDYQLLAVKDTSQRVSVSGKVEAEKTLTLSTRLTVPVSTLNAKVGDRVHADQLLATLDVSDLELELASKQAQNAAEDAASISQIESADRQASQFRDMVNSGHNPEINSASNALREAEASFAQAERDFKFERDLYDQGRTPELAQQETALDNARHGAITAAVNATRAASGVALDGAQAGQAGQAGQADQAGQAGQDGQAGQADAQQQAAAGQAQGATAINGALNVADAANQATQAVNTLNDAQRDYETALAQVDHKLVTSQQNVANAFEAKKSAAVNLETARISAENQMINNQAAVDDAVRQARAKQAAAGTADQKLQKDIASSEVRAPFGGVITNVAAQQGSATNGPILTVADDNRLIIHAEIKELDINKVQTGQRVEFTTPGTGNKKFEGKVIFVSPTSSSDNGMVSTGGSNAAGAGAAAGAAGAGGASASEKVTFPVEIEVVGNKDGLKLGATAKSRVVVKEASKKPSVPTTAVYKENSQSKVLVIADETIVERKVKTGDTIGSDIEISSGDVKKGEIVITDAEKYRPLIGQKVKVEEAPAEASSTTTKEAP